jgi:hypothetical protein
MRCSLPRDTAPFAFVNASPPAARDGVTPGPDHGRSQRANGASNVDAQLAVLVAALRAPVFGVERAHRPVKAGA